MPLGGPCKAFISPGELMFAAQKWAVIPWDPQVQPAGWHSYTLLIMKAINRKYPVLRGLVFSRLELLVFFSLAQELVHVKSETCQSRKLRFFIRKLKVHPFDQAQSVLYVFACYIGGEVSQMELGVLLSKRCHCECIHPLKKASTVIKLFLSFVRKGKKQKWGSKWLKTWHIKAGRGTICLFVFNHWLNLIHHLYLILFSPL